MSVEFRRRQANARLGETIAERYLLQSVMGTGGMGAVYRAKHLFTDREVALKLLFADVVQNRNAVARFLNEARAAARIGHPGVVDVSDAGVDSASGEVYLAMELLDGEDLASALDRGAMPLDRFLDVVADLLDTLAAAHAKGCVHRDVKPENLFLVGSADRLVRVKLLDFGIAHFSEREAGSQTAPGALLGTPYYMSPEQCLGLPVDARSDVWSVGAMVFHALAGRPPFDRGNVNQILLAIATEPAQSLRSVRPDLPAELAEVVDRALQKAPEERWPDAASLRGALLRVRELASGPAVTLSSAYRERSTRFEWSAAPHLSGANRGVPTLAAFALAAVAISLVLLGWSLTAKLSNRASSNSASAPVAAPLATSVDAPPRVDASARVTSTLAMSPDAARAPSVSSPDRITPARAPRAAPSAPRSAVSVASPRVLPPPRRNVQTGANEAPILQQEVE